LKVLSAESTYIKNGDRFRKFGVPIVLLTVAPTPSAVSTAYTFLMTFRETLSKFDAADMFVDKSRESDRVGCDRKELVSGLDSNMAQRTRATDASTSKQGADVLDI
jgi:hypothetical protein